MPIKFAKLDYVTNHSEIPIKFNVIKQNLTDNLNWYVDRYNPLKLSECSVAGETGLKALLPLTSHESFLNKPRTKKIILRAIENLRQNDVEIFLPPQNITLNNTNHLIADGTKLLPFFLNQTIKLWAKQTRRDLRYCETALINGNLPITESILDNLSNDLNFLTILDLNNDKDNLLHKSDQILSDTGLNIIIKSRNKAILRTADIIITTAAADLDNAYKRNALIIDLSANLDQRRKTIARRPDLTLIDGLILRYQNTAIPLQMFEMALYLKSRHYRHIIGKTYDTGTGAALESTLDRMGVGIYSFTQLGKIVKSG
jgi:hypothetical protein